MRKLVLGLIGVAALSLAAGPKAEAQQPKRGGTLNFAISAETPQYDCHGSDTYATLHFSSPFYSTLLRYNLSKFPDVEGDLAKSWTVSPDKKTYTFTLHDGVKFHDGSPMTSEDIKATYDRLRNPPKGVVSTRSATFADIESIETPNPTTVVFKLKAVNSSMLDHFASPWNCVYSAKDLAADPAAPRTKINGTVLHRFAVPDDPGVRVDTGVADGSVVSPHYDPMLAKVIAHGPTRADAARRLARTLARAQLHGVTTNRDLLVGILREEEFLAGSTDTGYLTRHDPSVLAARVPGALAVHAAAAALAAQVLDRLSSPVLRTLPAAWRNIVRTSQRASYRCGERAIGVAHRQVGDRVLIEVDGEPLSGVRVQAAAPQRVVLEIDGVRRSISVHRACGVSYVDSALGSTVLVEVPRFPDPSSARHAGSLVAPMPGTVVRVLATPGADVATGQGLIVLEAMKMEHTVTAPADGTVVDVCVAAGDQVDAGQTLAIVEDSSAASDGGQQ